MRKRLFVTMGRREMELALCLSKGAGLLFDRAPLSPGPLWQAVFCECPVALGSLT